MTGYSHEEKMTTTLIGDLNRFAIEYELETADPPYGRAKLYLDAMWFGDIRRSMFLYHIGRSLKAMVSRNPTVVPVYSSASTVPGDEELLSGVSWSWGDSFDDFLFVLYAVEEERCVHFIWSLHESRANDFPGYPLGVHHFRVPFTVFDTVVAEFTNTLAIS